MRATCVCREGRSWQREDAHPLVEDVFTVRVPFQIQRDGAQQPRVVVRVVQQQVLRHPALLRRHRPAGLQRVQKVVRQERVAGRVGARVPRAFAHLRRPRAHARQSAAVSDIVPPSLTNSAHVNSSRPECCVVEARGGRTPVGLAALSRRVEIPRCQKPFGMDVGVVFLRQPVGHQLVSLPWP